MMDCYSNLDPGSRSPTAHLAPGPCFECRKKIRSQWTGTKINKVYFNISAGPLPASSLVSTTIALTAIAMPPSKCADSLVHHSGHLWLQFLSNSQKHIMNGKRAWDVLRVCNCVRAQQMETPAMFVPLAVLRWHCGAWEVLVELLNI